MQTVIRSPQIALLGGSGAFPLAGHVRGGWDAAEASVAWVGRVQADAGPEAAWRASRTLERLLRRGGPAVGDRRRVLSVLWARLDGEELPDDLVLFLASRDADGFALSAVGCHTLYGLRDGALQPWLFPPHPLLGPPGAPVDRPGALAVDDLPPWLIATAEPVDLSGRTADATLPECGVHG